MKSPAHLPLDDSSEIDGLRQKRIRTCPEGTSVLRRALTITAIFAALLCNSLALGTDLNAKELGSKPIGVTRHPTPANTTSRMESAEPEIVAPTVETTTTVVEEAGTCYSHECNRSASEILRFMDPSVKPCDDFFKFTCGGFVKSTEFLPGLTRVSTLDILRDSIVRRLSWVAESESEPNETDCFRSAKEKYKSCMIKQAPKTMESLRETLTKLGGWPVLDGKKWNDSDFDWTVTIQKFKTDGFTSNNLFELSVQQDNENKTVSSITIEQPIYFRNPLSTEYSPFRIFTPDLLKGFDNEIVQAYYDYMVEVAVVMGADKDRARTELMESLWFEIELAGIIVPDAKLIRNGTITLAEMLNRHSSVPWKKLVTNSLSSNFSIGDNVPVNSEIVDYIDALLELMQKTSKRVQANYLMWRILENDLVRLCDDLKSKSSAFFRILSGVTERPPPWEICIFSVIYESEACADEIYLKKYFDSSSTEGLVEISRNVWEQYKEMLQGVEWTNETMRKNAFEKLNTLEIYAANRYINKTHSYTLDSLSIPLGQVDRWIYHSEDSNRIHVSASMLQSPFYNYDRPRYMNYGTTGYGMSHEMSHALESARPATLDNCIVEQYNKFHVKEVGLDLDGDTQKTQNVADHFGAKVAYHAYNNWTKGNKAEPKLPGLNYTAQQMFWISLGNLYCAKYTIQAMKYMIAYPTEYPPEEYRIFGTLSNSPEFAKDFNCPVGTRMNPAKKCPVW